MYTFYSVKFVFLGTIALFEVGSAICGAAPSSVAFIIGRAIAGVGAAGLFSGAVRRCPSSRPPNGFPPMSRRSLFVLTEPA